jgi:hypothetical protein
MAKGPHRPAQRIVLPNGMWLLLYEDGSLKLGGYDRRLEVTEVLNREGGAQLFVRIRPTKDRPKEVASRASDLVTVERSVITALRGIAQ